MFKKQIVDGMTQIGKFDGDKLEFGILQSNSGYTIRTPSKRQCTKLDKTLIFPDKKIIDIPIGPLQYIEVDPEQCSPDEVNDEYFLFGEPVNGQNLQIVIFRDTDNNMEDKCIIFLGILKSIDNGKVTGEGVIVKFNQSKQFFYEQYSETIVNNYINCKGVRVTQDMFIDGTFKEGLPNGNNIKVYMQNNQSFKGQYVNGIRQGKGEYTYNNGNTYKGEYQNGLKHGKGVYFYKDLERTYVGLWSEGKKIKNITDQQSLDEAILNEPNTNELQFANGDKFKGQFKKGKLNGFGILITKTGNIYKGDFLDDKKHGEGELTHSDGAIYTGAFENDEANGYGEMVFDKNNFYKGNWLNNEFSGQGELRFENGDVYNGEFLNGQIFGVGEAVYPNGDKYKGQWQNGQFSGEGVYYFSNGSIYKGQLLNGSREGRGIMDYFNGDRYEGEFKDGMKHGAGEYQFDDGGVYKGLFKQDKRDGYGEMEFVDGNIYKGRWKEDKLWDETCEFFLKDKGMTYKGSCFEQNEGQGYLNKHHAVWRNGECVVEE